MKNVSSRLKLWKNDKKHGKKIRDCRDGLAANTSFLSSDCVMSIVR